MKKLLFIVIVLVVAFSFAACSSPPPPGTSWADKEILVYDVIVDGESVGELTSTLERNPADKTIAGTEYKKATSILTVNYVNAENGQSVVIKSLLNDFAPLATYKKVTTGDKDYELSARYDNKYYNYTLKQNGEEFKDRIKVKAPFIDNDLLYTYLRCQNLDGGINTIISVPDAHSGGIQSLTAASQAAEKISVPFPDENKVINCNKVVLTRNASPVGKSIIVYFTPGGDEHTIPGSIGSINDSSKIPVKIVEGNITYMIKSISVI